MNTMRHLLVFAFLSLSAPLVLPITAMADYAKERDVAERFYAAGDFKNAHKTYKQLARKGDSFAQFRLSYMYLMGEGQEADVIESIAWSVLAAQDKQQEKVAYMRTVAEMVPQDQRVKANKKISYYMRKWGEDSGSDSRSHRNDKICTGFRLCNHKTNAGTVGVPSNLWNISGQPVNEQELRQRIDDINQSILNSEGVTAIEAADHEAS
jgi:hypothetical protein